MKEDKARLRAIYKSRRAQLTSVEKMRFSFEILEQFKIWLSTQKNLTHFHLFLPIQKEKEVDTFIIKEYLEEKKKQVFTSQIKSNSLEMDTFLLSSKTVFKESKMGIPVPIGAEKVDPHVVEVILIPLLAFDILGNRLGYGKGYYDSFLSGLAGGVIKVGLSYFLPEERIPFEAHDIPLDYCITPSKIFTF